MRALYYTHDIKCFANWVYGSFPAGIRTGFAGWFGEPALYPLSQSGQLYYERKIFSFKNNFERRTSIGYTPWSPYAARR